MIEYIFFPLIWKQSEFSFDEIVIRKDLIETLLLVANWPPIRARSTNHGRRTYVFARRTNDTLLIL